MENTSDLKGKPDSNLVEDKVNEKHKTDNIGQESIRNSNGNGNDKFLESDENDISKKEIERNDEDDNSNDDEDSNDNDDDFGDDNEEEYEDEENELQALLGSKNPRSENTSSSSSSAVVKRLRNNDDDDANDDDDEQDAKFVHEDLNETLDQTNIVPRAKRQAALASGLVRNNYSSSSSSSYKVQTFDSDDEEADF